MTTGPHFNADMIKYFGIINTTTAAAFALDKFLAISGGPRIPEIWLVTLGTMGGWVGGVISMIVFRHKTMKPSFHVKFAIAITVNIALARHLHLQSQETSMP